MAEVVHSRSPQFPADRFRAKYGEDPNWGSADKYGYGRTPSALCFFFYGNRIMPDDLKARLKTFVPPPAETKVQSFEQLPTVYDPPFEQWNSKKKKQEHGALIVQSDSSVYSKSVPNTPMTESHPFSGAIGFRNRKDKALSSHRTSTAPSSTGPLKNSAQHNRLVVAVITGRIDQGHRAMRLFQLSEMFSQCCLCSQLFAIASLKLDPAFGIVRKPLAKLVRRRNLLHPLIDSRFLF